MDGRCGLFNILDGNGSGELIDCNSKFGIISDDGLGGFVGGKDSDRRIWFFGFVGQRAVTAMMG